MWDLQTWINKAPRASASAERLATLPGSALPSIPVTPMRATAGDHPGTAWNC